MPTLTDAQSLVEAEDALHRLLTGTSARVFVDQNGERVEYTSANAGRLRAYIQELKDRINPPGVGASGPLRAVF